MFVVYNRRREAQIKYPNPDDDIRENIINYEDEGGGEDDMTAFDITPLQIPVATDPNLGHHSLPRSKIAAAHCKWWLRRSTGSGSSGISLSGNGSSGLALNGNDSSAIGRKGNGLSGISLSGNGSRGVTSNKRDSSASGWKSSGTNGVSMSSICSSGISFGGSGSKGLASNQVVVVVNQVPVGERVVVQKALDQSA